VELFLRYWAACPSWQGEVISFFLSAFYPALASPLITVTKERLGVGNHISKLQQAPQGKKFFKNKRTTTTTTKNKQKPQQTLNLTRKMEKEAILPLFYQRKAFFFSFSSSL